MEIKSNMKNIKRVFAISIFCIFVITAGCVANKKDKNEKKSFGEWMDVYVAEQEAAYKQHPDLKDIEKGAAILLTGIHTNPNGPQIGRDDCTPLGQRYYDAYENFINSNQGKAMLAKWKTNGELDEKDDAYKWIIYATIVEPHKFSKFEGEGLKIMKLVKRVYFRDIFTRAEVDSIRTYFVGMSKALGYTCGTFAYDGQRRWPDWGEMNWTELLEYPYGLPEGTKIPDIRYLSYDALIKKNPIDLTVGQRYNLHASLTPEGMQSFNACVNALEIKELDGRKVFTPSYAEWEGRDCLINLRDEVKKGKPIYVFSHSTLDTYDYIFDVSVQECLRMLFKDNVDFFHADSRTQGADYCGGKRYYLQSLWKNAVFKGAHYTSVHDKNDGFDSWLYQIRDAGYMRYPPKSAPVILDTRRAANRIAYTGTIGFVDKNGTKCPNIPNPKIAFYDQFLANYKDKIPSISYVPITYPMRLRWGIPLFKTMEAMDWEYQADSPHLKAYHDLCKNRTWQEFAFYIIENGVVKNVDLVKKELIVNGKVSKLKDAIEQDHVIHFGDNPRILSKTNDVGSISTNINDISAGDVVSALFQIKSDIEDHKYLRAVSRTDGFSPMFMMEDMFWVIGKTTKINPTKGVCTILMPKPDIANGEWLGYHYWQEAIDKYGISPLELNEKNNRTRNLYLTGEPMLSDDNNARTFNLLIDDGVEVSVNGIIENNLSKIKVGDKAVFSFNMSSIKNTHPAYRPWHLMVVTNDKIK